MMKENLRSENGESYEIMIFNSVKSKTKKTKSKRIENKNTKNTFFGII